MGLYYCVRCNKPFFRRNSRQTCSDTCSKELKKKQKIRNRRNQKAYQRRIRKSYRANRIWVLKQLGFQCEKCGYNKCKEALEIHHKNKELKPKLWDKKGKRVLFAKWYRLGHIPKKERKNILLLCANCHREHHFCSPAL